MSKKKTQSKPQTEVQETTNATPNKPKPVPTVNDRYNDLCASYGDAVIKSEGWNSEVIRLKAQIHELQASVKASAS